MAKPANNIRPLWFVSQLGITEDGNKPRVYPGEGDRAQPQQEDGPQPAQPRRVEINAGRLNLDAAPEGDASTGYGFSVARTNVITLAWTTEEAAQAYARDMAAKNPQTAYGVFACMGVVETTRPQVIEKKFNEAGELIVLEKVKNESDDRSAI